MHRANSAAASEEWHMVSGHSEDEGSERSMSTQGAPSRTPTPAVSLHFDHHALELGSECPPTPESERLANTVLCAPFTNAGPSQESPRAAMRPANSSVDACGPEVVGVRCLQGLSQEGPLEGFALRRPAPSTPPLSEGAEYDHDEMMDEELSQAMDTHEALAEGALVAEMVEEEDEGAEAEGGEGWQGLDQVHLAGMDSLVELLEGLGWSGNLLVDVYRASVAGAQQVLQRVTQGTVVRAQEVKKSTEEKCAQFLAYVGKMQGAGSPATGLLVSALSLTTLATLAGLFYFMGRCRTLRMALEHKDKEYARLVTRVLNLQAALSQSMQGPILRHTTNTFSLVSTTLM